MPNLRKTKASLPPSLDSSVDAGVVDTNIPLVGNGKHDKASRSCVISCVDVLESFTSGRRKLVIDDAWLIVQEYSHKLSQSGQPGVGDAFLKWVLNNQANPKHCQRVSIPTKADGTFKHFPSEEALEKFDPPDCKFVAVSIAYPGRAPIFQAWDTKWWSLRETLKTCGVEVVFVCQNDMEAGRDKLAKAKPRNRVKST